ncbi:hypothetical protein LIER_40744 [Lithospermum erythrorhizon]|uniref:Uncharacterized protein n=1 Tax=Lithospermum erythrorhizon TaxID=34254 RepID=A0AAV3QZ36_LITER
MEGKRIVNGVCIVVMLLLLSVNATAKSYKRCFEECALSTCIRFRTPWCLAFCGAKCKFFHHEEVETFTNDDCLVGCAVRKCTEEKVVAEDEMDLKSCLGSCEDGC